MQLFYRIKKLLWGWYKRRKRLVASGTLTVLGSFVIYGAFFAPPPPFPADSYVRVAEGETVAEIATDLKERSIIRSKTVFRVFVRLYGDERVTAGEYYFVEPQSALTIVRRLVHGTFGVLPTKLTIPEGTSVYGIARMLKEQVPEFDAEAFYELAAEKEGRLFPDTYFISPGEDPAVVLRRMEENFNAQVTQAGVALAVAAFGEPFEDIVIMASLLEKEANNSRDRRLIAGILWSRIKNEMPLQVDAIFPYIIGKNSFTITKEELETDSPYNTYTNKGLPPGAITNPGLEAIIDAVTPIDTDYVYYLSDREGTMHYSVTYEQHLRNKRKYIGS